MRRRRIGNGPRASAMNFEEAARRHLANSSARLRADSRGCVLAWAAAFHRRGLDFRAAQNWVRKPAIIFMVVDLPAPFGRGSRAPGLAPPLNEMPSTAVNSPCASSVGWFRSSSCHPRAALEAELARAAIPRVRGTTTVFLARQCRQPDRRNCRGRPPARRSAPARNAQNDILRVKRKFRLRAHMHQALAAGDGSDQDLRQPNAPAQRTA